MRDWLRGLLRLNSCVTILLRLELRHTCVGLSHAAVVVVDSSCVKSSGSD